MIKLLFVFIGSVVLYATVGVEAGMLAPARPLLHLTPWFATAVTLTTHVSAVVPQSEPALLALLGATFVLVSFQLRRKA